MRRLSATGSSFGLRARLPLTATLSTSVSGSAFGLTAATTSVGAAVPFGQRRTFFGPFKKKEPEAATAASGSGGDAADQTVGGAAKKAGLEKILEGAPDWAKKLQLKGLGALPGPKQLDKLEGDLQKMESTGYKPPNWALKVQEKSYGNLKLMLRQMDALGEKESERRTNLVRAISLSERMMKMGGREIPGGGLQEAANYASASSATTTSDTPATTSASSTADTTKEPWAGTGGGDGKVDLGAETEELFAELKAMRQKRNDLKAKLADKTEAHSSVSKDLGKLQTVEADLRKRLKLAENNVALLNSETLDLKDKAKDAKSNLQKVVQLERKVTSLKGQDTAPLTAEIQKLKSKVGDKDETLRSLQRKLDRSRRYSPLNQFSTMLSDIAKAGGQDYDATVLEPGFQTLQDQYHSKLSQDWENGGTAEDLGATNNLFGSCVQYLYATVPHAKLDVLCTPVNETAWLEAVRKEEGLVVAPAPKSALGDDATSGKSGFIVSCKDGHSEVPRIAPYAFVYALHQAAGLSGEASAATSNLRCSKLSPFLSDSLVKCEARSHTKMETARHSGPGGQAANVGETQVTLKLFIDSVLMVQSHSADTRSAHDNKKLADERLWGESIQNWNAKARAGNHDPLEVKLLRRRAVKKFSNDSQAEGETSGGHVAGAVGSGGGSAGASSAAEEEEIAALVATRLIPVEKWDKTLQAFHQLSITSTTTSTGGAANSASVSLIVSAVVQVVRAASSS